MKTKTAPAKCASADPSSAPLVRVSTVAVGPSAPFVALQRGNARDRSPHVYLKEYATAQVRTGCFVLLETAPRTHSTIPPDPTPPRRDGLTGVYEVGEVKGRVVFLAPSSYEGMLTQFEGDIDGVQGTLTPVSVTLTRMGGGEGGASSFQPQSRLTGSSRPLTEAVYTRGAFRQAPSSLTAPTPAVAPSVRRPPSLPASSLEVRVENHGVVVLTVAAPGTRHTPHSPPPSALHSCSFAPAAETEKTDVVEPRGANRPDTTSPSAPPPPRNRTPSPPVGGRGGVGGAAVAPPPSSSVVSSATTTTTAWRRRVQSGGDIVIRVCGCCGGEAEAEAEAEASGPSRCGCGRGLRPGRRCHRLVPAYVGGVAFMGVSIVAVTTIILVLVA